MSAITPYASVIVPISSATSPPACAVTNLVSHTRTSSTLKHPQHQQSRVRFLEGQTQTRTQVDRQCDDIDRPSTDNICQIAEYRWYDLLNDKVHRDGDVDQLDRHIEIRSDGLQSWEVDESGEWGEEARNGN